MHGLLHVGPIEEPRHNLQGLVHSKVSSKGGVMMLFKDGGEDGASTQRDAKPWVLGRFHKIPQVLLLVVLVILLLRLELGILGVGLLECI